MRRLLMLLPLLLAACGAGAGALPAAEVADDAETLLDRQYDVRPAITCPDGLPLEEGATTRCTLTAGDEATEYGVTVTVESVEDDEPQYLVEVDREPLD